MLRFGMKSVLWNSSRIKRLNMFDLCQTIEEYLVYLFNEQTFGEIYRISMRISSKTLRKVVVETWTLNAEEFNKNESSR
jgi:hypothetical protein